MEEFEELGQLDYIYEESPILQDDIEQNGEKQIKPI